MTSEFPRRVLDWYAIHARDLPWRSRNDPYAVWVAEIMLQQTRVETVIPYYERWMERFPGVEDLAKAELQEVLQLWEGLGYYGRARNLHEAARLVLERYGGKLPKSRRELQNLPGIGAYTSAAIASIAFGADEPALDGNIRRVMARVFDLDLPASAPEGRATLLAWLEEHLPPGRAGDFNQALMDLGAQICTPRQPKCGQCPLNGLCRAHQLGIEEQQPVAARRSPIPHYTVTAAVIWRDGRVLIARRPPQGLLGGLWEFPGGKVEPGEELAQALRREIKEELGAEIFVGEELGVFEHAYTHYRVTLHAFSCRLAGAEPRALEASAVRWVPPDGLGDFPMGKIDRQIALLLSKSLEF
jgi:A/G-specific adenine glycosylase